MLFAEREQNWAGGQARMALVLSAADVPDDGESGIEIKMRLMEAAFWTILPEP